MSELSNKTQFPVLKLFFLFLAVSGFLNLIIHPSQHSLGGDMARLASCESLVERGTFVIDDAVGISTVDKVIIGGHFYGCQTPFMPLMLALVYYPLHLIGFNFSSHYRFIEWFLTLVFSGGAAAGVSVILGKITLLVSNNYRRSLQTSFIFFFASLYLTYSLTMNNHVFGGFLLTLAFYLTVYQARSKITMFIAGFALAATVVTDPPAGLAMGLAMFVYLIHTKAPASQIVFFILGGIIPGITHSIANIAISGSVFPVNVKPEYFDYPGSVFNADNLSGVVANTTFAELTSYSFNALFGHRGLFIYTPVLIFAVWGLIRGLKNSGDRSKILTALLPTILVMAFYLWRTKNLGGSSYGMRFFISITPLIFLGFAYLPLRFKKKSVRIIFVFVIIVSLVFSAVGTLCAASDERLGINSFASNLFHHQSLHYPALSDYSWKVLAWLCNNHPDVLTFMGYWSFISGRYDIAETILKYSLTFEESSSTYHWLGELFTTMHMPDTAVVYLEKGFEIEPQPKIYSALGFAYSRLKKYEKGNFYINRYIEIADSIESLAPKALVENHLVVYNSGDRDNALSFLADNYIGLQDTAKAAEILAQIDLPPHSFFTLAAANLKLTVIRGDTSAVQSLLENITASRPAYYDMLKKEDILSEFLTSIEK